MRRTDVAQFMASLDGRHAAVVGVGVSNVPLIRFLCRAGARVTAFDQKPESELARELRELQGFPVNYRLGDGYLDTLPDFELVYLSPGVSPDQAGIRAARDAGAQFSSETDIVLRLARCQVVGITGSSGKTTTTTLTGRILTEYAQAEGSGRRVLVGGNIGTALVEQVMDLSDRDLIVLELSSFQLKSLRVSPDIAAVLNVTPNHLDVHPDMDDYIWSKENIVRHQSDDDWAIFGVDDEVAGAMARRAKGRQALFSAADEVERGGWLLGDELMLRWGGDAVRVLRRRDLLIPGMHNVQNSLAAMAISRAAGADVNSMVSAVSSFRGVEHRLEPVAEHKGVSYINDSIATTPTRTIAALRAVERPVVLIAGGYDKHLPFDEMADQAMGRVKAAVLIGVTADKIEHALIDAAERARVEPPVIIRALEFDEAVHAANDCACSGDAVLLSPACASYGMFRNFVERGRTFKEIVGGIIGDLHE